MMLKVTVSDSSQLELPRDVIEKLGLHEGEEIALVRDEENLRLLRMTSEQAKGLEFANEAISDYRETLDILAQ